MNIKKILGIFISLLTIITLSQTINIYKVSADNCNVDQIAIPQQNVNDVGYSIYFSNSGIIGCNTADYAVRISDSSGNAIGDIQLPNPYEGNINDPNDSVFDPNTGWPIENKSYDGGNGWTFVPIVGTDSTTGDKIIVGWNMTNSFNPSNYSGLQAGSYSIGVVDPRGQTQGNTTFTATVGTSGGSGSGSTGSGSTGSSGSSGASSGSTGPIFKTPGNLTGAQAIDKIKVYTEAIFNFIFPIAIIIAVIKILINIIQLASSQGNPNNLQQAKEELLATIIGLGTVAGAVTLIRLLGSALGI